MPNPVLMPSPRQRFFDNIGLPLVRGYVFTFAAGTSTKLAAYQDAAGLIPHENPIRLDDRGEATIYWLGNYKVDLRTAGPFSTQVPGYPVDNFNAVDVAASADGAVTLVKTQIAAAAGSALMGYSNFGNKITVEQALDGLYYGVHSVMNPRFAGGATIGSADSTAAFQACADYTAANGGKMYIPNAAFSIDRVMLNGFVYNAHIEFDGSQINGIATVARNAVFDMVNCVDTAVLGRHSVISANNANYDSAWQTRAQAGTSQATTRVNLYNITVRNFKTAFWNGQYNLDYQCSEITYYGAQCFGCPIAVYNGGINAGVQFDGGNLISETNTGFPGIAEKWLWMEGGFVTVVGATVFTNPSAAYGVLFNPCQSTQGGGNPYGTLTVSAVNVEMNSGLFFVSNPRNLGTPSSDGSSIIFAGGCRGYCGAPAATDYAVVADTTYAGLINITANNWYSALARTGYNISSASSLVKIVTDKTSMARNFKNWMGGIYGGILVHGMEPVARGFGLSQTYSAGTTTTLKFLASDLNNEFARYGGNYNLTTGEFTVPPGGFSHLQIQVSMLGSLLPNADLVVKKDNVLAGMGSWSASAGTMCVTLHNVAAGAKIKVDFTPYGAPSTSDAGAYNSFTMTGSTL